MSDIRGSLRAVRDYDTWEGIRDFLNNIPVGCEYYREDGYGNFESADDMFDDYKNDVLAEMDRYEAWEEDEEEYGEEDDGPIDEDPVDEDDEIEDVSFLSVVGRSA